MAAVKEILKLLEKRINSLEKKVSDLELSISCSNNTSTEKIGRVTKFEDSLDDSYPSPVDLTNNDQNSSNTAIQKYIYTKNDIRKVKDSLNLTDEANLRSQYKVTITQTDPKSMLSYIIP